MDRPNPKPATGATDSALRSLDVPSLFTTLYALFLLVPVPGIRPVLPLLTALLIVPGLFLGLRAPLPVLRTVWRATAGLFIGCMAVANLVGAIPSFLALVSICLFLLIMHWFSPRGLREHLQIWALGALLLLVGGLMGGGLLGLVILVGWCVASAQLLNLLGHFRAGVSARRAPHEVAPVSLRSVWGVSPLLLLVTMLVFLAAPRFRAPTSMESQDLRLEPRDRVVVQAGFSETVSLRSMADIKLTEGIAFRVVAKGAAVAPSELRYRVNVLDDFDGWDWKRLATRADATALENKGGVVTFPPRDAQDGSAPVDVVGPRDWYEIEIVDLPGGVMPLPETAHAVDGIPPGRTIALELDGRLSVGGGRTPISYSVLATSFPAADADYPLLDGPVLQSHLAVPASLEEPLRLAIRGVVPNVDTLPVDKARILQSWLRRNGVYTLEVGDYQDGPGAIRRFIDEGLRGHCELFATAYALALRVEGIPSRLVTGFNPGSMDSTTDLLSVHHRDAHAWVEAWLPGRGWVAFDPTPSPVLSSDSGQLAGGAARRVFNEQTAALATAFEGYGYENQRRVLSRVRREVASFLRTWERGALLRAGARIARNAAEPVVLLAALILAAINGAAWLLYLRRPRVARPSRATEPRAEAPRLLRDILRALGGEIPRLAGADSPGRLIIVQGNRRGLDAADSEQLAELYTRWRYRGGDREVEREIRELLRRARS